MDQSNAILRDERVYEIDKMPPGTYRPLVVAITPKTSAQRLMAHLVEERGLQDKGRYQMFAFTHPPTPSLPPLPSNQIPRQPLRGADGTSDKRDLVSCLHQDINPHELTAIERLICQVSLRYLKSVVVTSSPRKCAYPALKEKKQSDTRAEVDGKSLRALRRSLSLTQKQLADLLGVQRVTITRAEGTEARPSRPSRLLQSLLDQALARGQLKVPPESQKKRSKKK